MSGHFRTALMAVLMLFVFAAGSLMLPGGAQAQPSKKTNTKCSQCHNGALTAGQTTHASVNGVEGTSFALPPSSSFEIDWLFKGMRGYTPTRGVTPYLALPAGWTPALTTNTSNPATVGGVAWNGFWDNAFTQGTPSDTPTWQASGAEDGTVAGLVSTNVYKMLMEGSSWEKGSGSVFDDGTAGDLDGITDVMGADARFTLPATGGPWTIYVGGVGHGASVKALTYVAVTISLSGGDTTPPNVTTTVPTNGATGVALNSQVTINFDENVNCGTVNTTNITSTSPTWTINSCAGSTAIFDTGGQANSTAYNVNVTTAVTDVAGNPLSAAYPFSFTTAAAVNNNPNAPTGLAQFRSNGTTPITAGGYTTETSVVIEADVSDADGGDTLQLEVDIDGNGTVDCSSAAGLANPSNNVQVTCSVVDGNSYDWQVRTTDNSAANSPWAPFAGTPDFIVDATAPSVSTTVPTNGATGVATDAQVTINFSENILCSTVNTTNITSDSPGWALFSCSGSTAVFDTSGQSVSTSYNVSVTSAVTDPG